MTENAAELFPDGSPISPWFYDCEAPKLEALGKQYLLTDYGVKDDGRVHTRELQALIDRVAAEGGGVLVVGAGSYLTGAVWLKQGVHLYVENGGLLKGSDDVTDYPVGKTRIEGQSCDYLPALINVEGCDGTVICGPGTIDGSGERSWKAFWHRRAWNPACTNKDEQRARLLFVSNSRNITIAGLRLQNAQFWTSHFYKCDHVKILGCSITSPHEPVKAPSTDAIDLDVCSDVLVKNCFMDVNDDAVALKGGKGAYADRAPENGSNERIIIEDCSYGFCHGCLTLGSESIHNRNIILRRIEVKSGYNLLWLKMRPDTPQHYEHLLVEDISGSVDNFISVLPWTQFFDLQGRKDMPVSRADHVTMRRCSCACKTAFQVEEKADQYQLADFRFEELQLEAQEAGNRIFAVAGGYRA